jgi:hypothetical protein
MSALEGKQDELFRDHYELKRSMRPVDPSPETQALLFRQIDILIGK